MKIGGRLFIAAFVALAMVPLLVPFSAALVRDTGDVALDLPQSPLPYASGSRLVHLAQNTLLLVVGTIAFALPLGIVLAVLCFRTNLPGRHLLVAGTVFALFLPVPLVVSAWQALVGSDGLFPLWFWGTNADRPWMPAWCPQSGCTASRACPGQS